MEQPQETGHVVPHTSHASELAGCVRDGTWVSLNQLRAVPWSEAIPPKQINSMSSLFRWLPHL